MVGFSLGNWACKVVIEIVVRNLFSRIDSLLFKCQPLADLLKHERRHFDCLRCLTRVEEVDLCSHDLRWRVQILVSHGQISQVLGMHELIGGHREVFVDVRIPGVN